MKRILLKLCRLEVTLAVALGAAGEFWARRALRRLRKLSGEPSKNTGFPSVNGEGF